MLLNDDIQLFLVQMILNFQKEKKCNYVHYWNFFKIKFKSFHLNKISIRFNFMKIYVFVMF
jgi:hypothetical protein